MLSVISDPFLLALLAKRRQERDALLARAVTRLQADDRVVAAWLFGSMGRGTQDDLSDLDLFVVVEDRHASQMIADRYAQMERIGTPLLILEAPQNRPPDGAYNMALYAGQNGPHSAPRDKMRLLRLVAADAASRLPALAARGARVPDAIAPACEKYLQFVEALIAAQ